MTRFSWQVALTAAVALILGAGSSQAVLITWEFGGVIDTVSDPANTLGGQVQIGDAFHGSITFDSEAEDTRPNDDEYGRYLALHMEADVGDLHIDVPSTTPETVSVDNSRWLDVLSFGSYLFDSGSLFVAEFGTILGDDDASVFSSDELPLTPPGLLEFEERRFDLIGFQDESQSTGRFEAQGTMTYLTPEPTSLLMITLGWAGLIRKRCETIASRPFRLFRG